FTKAQDIEAVSIGIKAGEHTRLYCLPSVSAFIGGDIVAGAYVCGLQKEPGCILFIDIGTNGEIVLADHGHLLSCSCAAGPALEGMNISCGTRAASGAIEDVKITEEGVILTTIEQEPAMGICGSGILAVVKELIRTGLVKKSGAFIKRSELDPLDYRYSMIQENGKKREFILSEHPKFLITQSDIRQVQLAKGAILSGFNALLKVAGKEMKDLDKVLIAGQFGAHLSKDSLTGTGILPQEIQSKLEYLGNSAKTGAYMALMSEEIKREMEELAMAVDYMELAETKGYERVFTDSLIFPEL
ncbi:MAG: ASKHA domain-containing protein, partial [Anaerovoracaceae bacterium]